MNIELMKRLEDAKQKLSDVSLKLDSLISVKKEQYIKTVRNDFSNFFKEKGFQVSADESGITATYGSLVARLFHESPETNFLGSYFVFNLDFKAINRKQYSMMLSNNAPSVSVSVSSKRLSDDDLQNEIKSIHKSIDEAQKRFNNFSQEVWKLFVKDDSEGRPFYQGYNSIGEFIGTLIE